jgi:hypothetical protein
MVTGVSCTIALGRAEPGNDSAPHARLVSVRVYPRSAGVHRVVVPIKGFTFSVKFSACASCPEKSKPISNVRVFFITNYGFVICDAKVYRKIRTVVLVSAIFVANTDLTGFTTSPSSIISTFASE